MKNHLFFLRLLLALPVIILQPAGAITYVPGSVTTVLSAFKPGVSQNFWPSNLGLFLYDYTSIRTSPMGCSLTSPEEGGVFSNQTLSGDFGEFIVNPFNANGITLNTITSLTATITLNSSSGINPTALTFYCGVIIPSDVSEADIKQINYSKIVISNLRTVAIPELSVPSSLDLGQCQAGSMAGLSRMMTFTRRYTGDHAGLGGSLRTTVTASTTNPDGGSSLPRITTPDESVDLASTPYTVSNDNDITEQLNVSLGTCPSAAGAYQWAATLTYTIE
ncbi:hypothetical protein [Klebsiella variicola]|uniref:hypothetical protein n=1 Tax=Klebsiella variicola TaxID=244366 RepID=UPI001CCFA61D|nr:hypothetical protein [Klebsiella variicola]MBZ7205101.1 hypothetical protein [Klebsiella variicola]MDT7003601.1 hypothetical protein [Klebsiella variicola]MDT7028307.1 hypothetical protein [Klebsiella variicola]